MEAVDRIKPLSHRDMNAEHRDMDAVLDLRLELARLQRLSNYFTAGLLLLLAALLASLSGLMLGGGGKPSPGRQVIMQPCTHAAGLGAKRQEQENPSAMLTAPTGSPSAGGDLQWESESGNAFCQGGFNFSSGSLLVPRAGIYRVFLQITFERRPGACSAGEQINLSNIVHYYCVSYPKKVALLSSVDTVTCTEHLWSKSLYTAGLFSLDANSKLSVKSSQPGLISNREQLVFFGAELVSVISP